MKLSVERHIWPVPRPYIECGWEGRSIWIDFAFGARHSEDILNVCLFHTLSDRQYRWLVRLFT
jgi:hypothetical protein